MIDVGEHTVETVRSGLVVPQDFADESPKAQVQPE